MTAIMNANVNLTTVQSSVLNFTSNALNVVEFNAIPGFDISKFVAKFIVSSNYKGAGYGVINSAYSANGVTLSLTTQMRRLYHEEFTRFLQQTTKPIIAPNPIIAPPLVISTQNAALNTATPSATISKTVTTSLPSSATFSLSYVQNPNVYIEYNSPVINSQVVTISASTGTTAYQFPVSATPIAVTIPWAYVPFQVNGVYTTSCSVLEYVNNLWVPSSTCMLTASTNNTQASVSCSEFATIGVTCKGGVVNPQIYLTTSNTAFVAFSGLLIALIALVLF